MPWSCLILFRQRYIVLDRPDCQKAVRSAEKAPPAANLIGTVTKTKDPMGTKAKAQAKSGAKLDVATLEGSKGHIGVKCPYKWSNTIDEEDDQGSSLGSEPEAGEPEYVASLEALDDDGEWCWSRRNRITRWRKREEQRPTFHYFAEDDGEEQTSGGLNQSAGGAQWI